MQNNGGAWGFKFKARNISESSEEQGTRMLCLHSPETWLTKGTPAHKEHAGTWPVHNLSH